VLHTQDIGDENAKYVRMINNLSKRYTRKKGEQDLFDLDADPYERNNLAAQPDQEERVADLRKQTLDWWKCTGGGPLKDVN
jgi:arylsulfatase A-like enzyme